MIMKEQNKEWNS